MAVSRMTYLGSMSEVPCREMQIYTYFVEAVANDCWTRKRFMNYPG